MKIYIAGKVSKESIFGTHHWRGDFCNKLSELSGIELNSIDPTKMNFNPNNNEEVFGGDAYVISKTDALVVYLSDDISIGGCQEILIAKYFKKPVIGLAPLGGKFNGSTREFFGHKVDNFKDSFVFTTCDVVCGTIEEVADELKNLDKIKTKSIDIIGNLAQKFEKEYLPSNNYLKSRLS